MNREIVMRIREMERLFDAVSLAVQDGKANTPEIISMLHTLLYYMDSGLWLSDFEADERGELPPDLKRGVLSEDGLYNLLMND